MKTGILKSPPHCCVLKYNNIEFLRFLFSLIIVYMHFTHEPAVRALYLIQSFNSKRAYLVVEFFFIIAGFFLFCTYKNKEQSWIRFVLRKFIRLWPALVCFSIASMVLHFFTYTGSIRDLILIC